MSEDKSDIEKELLYMGSIPIPSSIAEFSSLFRPFSKTLKFR